MSAVSPLRPEALYRPCDLSRLRFETTDELEVLSGIPGQERAREAVSLGMGVPSRGYNLFVLGPAGLGKRSLVHDILAERAAEEPSPFDWCYVNNFSQSHRPRALRLPGGRGKGLAQDMRQFVEELRASIPALFEGEEYRNRSEQIDAEINERQARIFMELGEESARENIALLHTPVGFSLAPARQGEVLSPEEFEKLSPGERRDIETKILRLQEKLQKTVRQVQQLRKEKRSRIKQLNREMTMLVVGTLSDELKHKYVELPAVVSYLDEVQADVLDNIDEFRRPPEAESSILGIHVAEPPSFRRYEVNVIVGDHGEVAGAPVVIEDHPTYQNLMGRVEYVARLGTLATDFALIKPGALHRANGGYLLVDVHKLLTQPFSWEALKRALATGEIRTESLGQTYGLISTVTLEPEPIPLKVKVVLLGDRLLYYLLLAFDPEFGELFKVQADFSEEIARRDDTEALYARLIATVARREGLMPLERAAVERTIEELARWAEDGEKLSAHLERLLNLLREADYVVRKAGRHRMEAADMQEAIDHQVRRADRVKEKIHEAILRGDLLVDTDGGKVGQANALSVSVAGNYAFAFPARITASTRLGDGEVMDIQREVALSGPIHSKGVLILAAFLASRYCADRPHSLSASLVFEQTYGMVDGDSASVAELAALLSSLGNFPLKQSLAVTGSVNQHGQVQPIGAANVKIEGFFDVCAARGLTGRQGVVIPAANVKHLMLRRDVVEATAAGRFHIYPVTTIDQVTALLSELPAGEADGNGRFPDGSVNFRVSARLQELARVRMAYGVPAPKLKKVREHKPSREPELPEAGK